MKNYFPGNPIEILEKKVKNIKNRKYSIIEINFVLIKMEFKI